MSYPYYCPKCDKSLKGESIPLKQRKFFGNQTHFLAAISIYDWEKDRTVAWKCPFCKHQWERK